ncbi:MAG TPA: hypothetical protein VHW70_03280, partial [Edaphobacter sp.]|nr:hypothetical protein [Edaphobacter sp.]
KLKHISRAYWLGEWDNEISVDRGERKGLLVVFRPSAGRPQTPWFASHNSRKPALTDAPSFGTQRNDIDIQDVHFQKTLEMEVQIWSSHITMIHCRITVIRQANSTSEELVIVEDIDEA